MDVPPQATVLSLNFLSVEGLKAVLSFVQPTVQRRQMAQHSSPKPRGLVASLMMSSESYSQGYRCPIRTHFKQGQRACGMQLWERHGPFLIPRGRVYPGCLRLPICGHTWFLALTVLPAAVLRRSRVEVPGASLGDPNHSQGGRHFLSGGTIADLWWWL